MRKGNYHPDITSNEALLTHDDDSHLFVFCGNPKICQSQQYTDYQRIAGGSIIAGKTMGLDCGDGGASSDHNYFVHDILKIATKEGPLIPQQGMTNLFWPRNDILSGSNSLPSVTWTYETVPGDDDKIATMYLTVQYSNTNEALSFTDRWKFPYTGSVASFADLVDSAP